VGAAVNEIRNPTFGNIADRFLGWDTYKPGAGSGDSRTTTDDGTGNHYAALTPGTGYSAMGLGATPPDYLIPVEAGKTYTLSGHARLSAAGSVGFRAWIEFLNVSGAVVGSQTGAVVTATSTAWRRAWVTATAPVNAVNAQVYVYFTTPFAGSPLRIDKLQFTESAILYPYFDGDFAAAGWIGTPHNSASRYPAEVEARIQPRFEFEITRRAWAKTQEILSGATDGPIPGGFIEVGWHGTDTYPEAGATCLARAGSEFERYIGEILKISSHMHRSAVGRPRTVFVYCAGARDVPWPFSLSRRAFASITGPYVSAIPMLVEVVR
jgi:hypothetical protein